MVDTTANTLIGCIAAAVHVCLAARDVGDSTDAPRRCEYVPHMYNHDRCSVLTDEYPGVYVHV